MRRVSGASTVGGPASCDRLAAAVPGLQVASAPMTTSGATSPRWTRALVTGASSGIGEAIARRLAGEGTDLVLVARCQPALDELASELAARDGVAVEVLVADLSAPVASAAVERRLRSVDSPIDLLVNNAGFGTSGPFVEMPVAREQQQIELNVVALTRLTSAAVGAMATAGRGDVLNIASIAGLYPAPGGATYAATKAYVVSFSQALHAELAGTPVGVTVSLPGFTRTDFHRRSGSDPSGVPARLWMDADAVAAISLDATARGDSKVVPGVLNKLVAGAVGVAPASSVARTVGRLRRRTHR